MNIHLKCHNWAVNNIIISTKLRDTTDDARL